jgi:squalene/oxidosqualene cyclase-like protein
MKGSYDVVVIGAGPVGCVSALAFARKGASVLLLEANPRASQRLAGEWLHPPAVEILTDLGVPPVAEHDYDFGRGFAVFPDDDAGSLVLPYREGTRGFSCEHSVLVDRLRARVRQTPAIEYVLGRATAIVDQRVDVQRKEGDTRSVWAGTIVGAGGRSSVAHAALGIDHRSATYSRMAGLLLEDVELPHEGFGHVFLGGPGPILSYRLDQRYVRVCLDVPMSMPVSRSKEAALWDGFHAVLPEKMRPAFWRALYAGNIGWAANQTRPRKAMGREGLALIGDAAGHHHPLTAAGMTLGFQDAIALAESKTFTEFREKRIRDSRVPEMLAVALYEVFADPSDECVAIRKAVYDMWRHDPLERSRTMAFLACQDHHPLRFGNSFLKATVIGGRGFARQAVQSGQWRYVAGVASELASRARWLLSGALRFSDPRPYALTADGAYGGALRAAGAKAEVVEHPARVKQAEQRAQHAAEPTIALERAVRALERVQGDDGSWEGENVWCPMLAAQYAIMCHLTGTELTAERRARILRAFQYEQLPNGAWGMHELSEPYLFVTTLVYVAARLLGVAADDALVVRARAFLRDEGGVVAIPTWGKFWLAMLGLYEWRGVNPVLPELWSMPRWLPTHPSRYYCHTRLIYLGMASLYGETFTARDADLQRALRSELFPGGYESVDWEAARSELRDAEIFSPPTAPLKAVYKALTWVDQRATSEKRAAARDELREHIRFELRSSDYTCISPVSGLLNLLALYRHDPEDADFKRQRAHFEGWIWEDDQMGLRVAGARSATWDSSFAMQALAAAAPHFDVTRTLERADAFLRSQQIKKPQARGYKDHYRLDPVGGFCFAGVWHGWPVSDCTAEAMLALMDAPGARATEEELTAAAKFVLQCQNGDGGFGSYERRKVDMKLEWLNPAEMFGDSMTEHSYVECTASCISALRRFRERYPDVLVDEIEGAIARGGQRIRRLQRPDGAWSGNWGIHFTYGTMFGIRGLLAAGARPQDPAIRKACRFLITHQRVDGGWGEHYSACLDDRYHDHDSQVIQTAWALMALLEAHDPDWDAIERAAHFLAAKQLPDGSFPKQDPAGVFFHTALLDYVAYRTYFPVWALGMYETRRQERLELVYRGRSRGVAQQA